MQDNRKTNFVKLKRNKKCVDLGQDNYPVRLYLQKCECDPYNWFEDQFGYFSSSAKQYQDKQLIPRCQENKFDHEVHTFYDMCEH